MTHDLWTTLSAKMYEYLTSVKLSDLADEQLQKAAKDVSLVRDAHRGGPDARAKAIAVPA